MHTRYAVKKQFKHILKAVTKLVGYHSNARVKILKFT